jgi:hypothetical protein
MGAFSYIFANYLFLQCGQTFGSDFSPANLDLISQAVASWQKPFTLATLVTQHPHNLDKPKWCRLLKRHCSTAFLVAVTDSINTVVLYSQGLSVPTPHHVIIEDDIYVDIFDPDSIDQAIEASIRAVFILLEKSDLDRCQDP